MKKINRRQFIKQSVQSALGAGFVLVNWHNRVPSAYAPTATVLYSWAGALTAHSIRVKARISTLVSTPVRLAISQNPTLSSPLYSAVGTAESSNGFMANLAFNGLIPATQYYYGLEVNGVLDTNRVRPFRTPASGPFSFTFASSSCAWHDTNRAIFSRIRAHNPLFFLHMGDIHYFDSDNTKPYPYTRQILRDAFDFVFNRAAANLYEYVPMAYIWDDHDYLGNNSIGNQPGRLDARLAYQDFVPHYPLPAGSGDVPIYHAFTIGRVRFVLTDGRSERTAHTFPTDPNTSILGAAQKAWFKQELLAAKNAGQFVVWMCNVPWLGGPAGEPQDFDGWYGYQSERNELANFIHDEGLTNRLLAIAGDAHLLAIDNGEHNTVADGGGTGFPIFQTAALTRSATPHGGTYTFGPHLAQEQYGLITVTDTGGETIEIHLSGRWYADLGGGIREDREVMSYTFTAPMPAPTAVTLSHQQANSIAGNDGTALVAAAVLTAATAAAYRDNRTEE